MGCRTPCRPNLCTALWLEGTAQWPRPNPSSHIPFPPTFPTPPHTKTHAAARALSFASAAELAPAQKRGKSQAAEHSRPRTDWQKRDKDTWIKSVPLWWCEHKMVHFASTLVTVSRGWGSVLRGVCLAWRCWEARAIVEGARGFAGVGDNGCASYDIDGACRSRPAVMASPCNSFPGRQGPQGAVWLPE